MSNRGKSVMARIGICAIGIVKLPFTLLSLVSTGIEVALVFLMRTVIGWLGSEDDVEVYNEAMDAARKSLSNTSELFYEMKL